MITIDSRNVCKICRMMKFKLPNLDTEKLTPIERQNQYPTKKNKGKKYESKTSKKLGGE